MTQKLLVTLLIVNLLGSNAFPKLDKLEKMGKLDKLEKLGKLDKLSTPLTYFCGPCKTLLEKFRCKIPTADELADRSLKLLIQEQCAEYTAGIPFALQLCVKAGDAAMRKILDKVKENVNTGRRFHPADDCATMKFCE
ncbi:unnamed protein product [Bursaphelenchus xylophilus]|uniref:(pine wood nematode) hypothetical protein n=1 Tax=Bursaphelenchus xylophilus TaxID=6326 RepID=A0A1I7SCP8_BURXY|nr:unnamed protein product [Bursaphelenchus xylophilus]CAG9093718.1 unnamed protein product [Bursaphelenchus xylophilus]